MGTNSLKHQMTVSHISQLKRQFIAAVFRSAPVAALARFVRHFLESFIQQSHLAIMQEAEKSTIAQVQLRSDVAALVNRQTQMAADLENLASQHMRLQESVQLLTGRGASASQHSGLFLTNTNGGIFVLKSGDLISESVATEGCWDAHVLAVMEAVARERPGTAIDVGAHFGVLSAAMARHFRRVISFEPNAFNFRLLIANMSINGLRHVECHPVALFSKDTTLSLGNQDAQEIPLPLKINGKFDGLASSNLGAYLFTENGTGIFCGISRTLDSYGLDDVVFLKIDAQGADGEVLRGSIETIRRCRPVIVFEWEEFLSRNYQTSIEDVWGLLAEAGYDVNVLKQTNDKQSDYICRPRTVDTALQAR